ncbi:MAG: F0F1 ATP synthase subunit alpha [Candidatus Kaiserbacteria bacterium]|nr:F0F1 ATP synthase subunit alpha [Candidatus Kaiserbacteria bacterium]
MEDALRKIKDRISHITLESEQEGVGRVIAVRDGVAEIAGLSDAWYSETVRFETSEGEPIQDALEKKPVTGLLLSLNEHTVSAVILADAAQIKEGMLVKRTESLLSVNVSDDFMGRVVTPLGVPIDGGPDLPAGTAMPLERPCYGVLDRQSVNEPLHTGITIIDAAIPIGRGQRELIIGDRSTGKTTIAVDTIINQKHEPDEKRPICIYVAIGQKDVHVARTVAKLRDAGALPYTVIVTAGSSEPAPLQYLAPFAGAGIADYFLEQGKDVLIVYDDLSKHAVAYRQLSLLLRRPPGREAYPGDIFYLHSRLLERAVRRRDDLGGGSITALPIIETQEGDVSAYISTNVISITDGQIFLDADLFSMGIRPAVDVGISVSRVGSSAQTKAMKGGAGSISQDLAQYRELVAFVQFAQDLDDETKERIDRGKRLVSFFTQDEGSPLPFDHEALLLFAVQNGLLNEVPADDVPNTRDAFVSFITAHHPEIPETIRTTKEIPESLEKRITDAITAFASAKQTP